MTTRLADWENELRKWLQIVERSARKQAGALLAAIPPREEWSNFLQAVEDEWSDWREDLERRPNCLLVLYGGLAFYEYDDNTLWKQFAKAVGCPAIPGSEQTEINRRFAKVAQELGLTVYRQNYVGSAINHIGIPLSLWDGFLDVCEWALAQSDWEELTDEEWAAVAAKRAGSRTRLAAFLRDNREVATELINEMHTARRKLFADPALTIADLPQSSLLRREYFEDVPETAEFLFPQNPDRFIADPLLFDRAKLSWSDTGCHINLDLPAIAHDKLPATWHVGERERRAETSSDRWRIDSSAFSERIAVDLRAGTQLRRHVLRGVSPWGLFDLENEMLVNPERQHLPLRPYILVSPHKLDHLTCDGFDDGDYPLNEEDTFDDGTPFFTTRLYPNSKRAQLTITHGSCTSKIIFRPSARLEAKIYTGEGAHAASFSRFENERDKWIKLERLPLPCVAVPLGYFDDSATILKSRFHVALDEESTEGVWEQRHTDDTHEYFFWKWMDATSQSLPVGKKTVSIQAPELNFKYSLQIELMRSKQGMDECWRNLPGAMLPMFLLAQTIEGMKLDAIVLARDAVAPGLHVSHRLLRAYERHGFVKQRREAWQLSKSRAVLEQTSNGELHVRFCGDPSVLWRMYRRLYDQEPTTRFPVIEVVNERPTLPYLLMRWDNDEAWKIKRYFNNHNVQIVTDLWS